ncbi:MAG: hypothetical protein AAFO58_05455, partial [Pseudomonadota bacterium]
RSCLIPAFAIWATTVTAQTAPALSPEAFEAATTGRTFTFAAPGATQPYGAERYLPGRRVVWSWLNGDVCQFGEWFVDLELICFVYETDGSPQCWSFYAEADGMTAQFENLEDSAPRYNLTETDADLDCTGPLFGS